MHIYARSREYPAAMVLCNEMSFQRDSTQGSLGWLSKERLGEQR